VRLLIFGHVSHTGFGVVTEALGKRFLGNGVDIRILAVNHRGEPLKGPLAGHVWPASVMGDPYAGNISANAIDGSLWRKLDPSDDWKPDAVLVVSDMSGFYGHVGQRGISGAWTTVPVFHYCPIEGDNLPPSWKDTWNKVNPVAMSDFGQQVISSHIGRAVPRIYHGVDTDVFHPLTPTNPVYWKGKPIVSKHEAKVALGLNPDRKLLFRSDRLVERKFYDRLLAAMVPIMQADPLVDLLIHCRPVDEGLNLHEEIARLPSDVMTRIMLTNAHDTWKGLPVEGMVVLMNAADLYVSTTGGEGFGLNLAESLACGTPVICTGWAAEKEVVGAGGVLIPPLTDSYGDPVRYHSGYGMDWAVPDPKGFTEPILHLLSKPTKRRELGNVGRAHVKRSFSWDEAASRFMALFEAVDGSARLAS
jgi:glycosyltransferase involved in cell wall biosynthesis